MPKKRLPPKAFIPTLPYGALSTVTSGVESTYVTKSNEVSAFCMESHDTAPNPSIEVTGDSRRTGPEGEKPETRLARPRRGESRRSVDINDLPLALLFGLRGKKPFIPDDQWNPAPSEQATPSNESGEMDDTRHVEIDSSGQGLNPENIARDPDHPDDWKFPKRSPILSPNTAGLISSYFSANLPGYFVTDRSASVDLAESGPHAPEAFGGPVDPPDSPSPSSCQNRHSDPEGDKTDLEEIGQFFSELTDPQNTFDEENGLDIRPNPLPTESEFEYDGEYYMAVRDGRFADAFTNRLRLHRAYLIKKHPHCIFGDSRTMLSHMVADVLELRSSVNAVEEIPVESLCKVLNECLTTFLTEGGE